MSHSHSTIEPPLSAEQLPDDPATLKGMILELLAAMQQRDRDNAALQHRLELLLRRLYGPRGERFDPNQCLLFPDTAADQLSATAPLEQPDAQEKPKRKCRPHGRRRLPEHLPRVPRHHELTLAERIYSSCGQQREEIGIDTSEQLDYKPASLFVIEHIVHKYACVCCNKTRQQALPPLPVASVVPQSTPLSESPSSSLPTTDVTGSKSHEHTRRTHVRAASAGPAGRAPPSLSPTPTPPAAVVIAATDPAMPIARGLAGPGLLAHLIVSKYEDHLPLYRLENIYERQGLFLPRSTLCDWLLACGQLLRGLYDRLVYHTLLSRALHTDDTPVKLQDPKTHLLSTARMWVYLGDAAHPYNVFDFTLNRRRDGPQKFLSGYQGYLHADAFGGYDCLYLPDPLATQARIVEVACNAHARRKFYEAQSSDLLRSTQALAYYRQLYELERQARDFDEFQRMRMRQDLSLPILEKFRAWIDKEYAEVLPRSPVAEALGYARNNWTALVRYTEAGFLAIDNNVAEREMKRIAIGRKNWLFIGSKQGGEMAAVMMSFASTCKRLDVEPWAYLQDVLTRLPTTPVGSLDTLLPDRWKADQRVSQPPPIPPEQSGAGARRLPELVPAIVVPSGPTEELPLVPAAPWLAGGSSTPRPPPVRTATRFAGRTP